MTELPSGTVTFLFTDMEGSTQLLKQLGEGYGEVLTAHQSILREAFAASDGQEIDTQGDSFFVAFRRAKDAIAAAIDGQRGLATHRWPDEVNLRVRMGVHSGEPLVQSDGYVGMGVNRAARIMAAAHGGQILVSNATRELIEDDLGPHVSLRDLDEHRLKDIDRPERLFQVVADGLATDFPALRTEIVATAYSGLEDELAAAAHAAVGHKPRVSRRLVVVALCLGLLGAAATAGTFLLAGGDSARAQLRVEPNSAVALDPTTGNVVASVEVGSGPVRAAVGGGGVWVANANAGTVSRIDPTTRAVVQTIDVGSGPVGIAFGGDSVWVTNGAEGTLSRISVVTSKVVDTIGGLLGPRGVAYGEHGVWVANVDDRSVLRLDPETGLPVRKITMGGTPTAVAVGGGSVWVTSESGSRVSRISPRTNAVTQEINVGNGPGAIAAGLGAIWVANTLEGTVSRIDPKTGTVVGVIPVGEGPRDIAVAKGAIWVANEFSGTVSRIDPHTNLVSSSTAIGSRPTGLAVGDAIWVTVRTAGGAHRGGTFTFDVVSSAVDSIDPAMAYTSVSWQLLSLTGDGLTTFRRVGGSEGTSVVADLATALPTPTDDGKTYTFQLRPGIRYSTGATVEPRDIRTALERDFELGSPGADYYKRIVGARSCRMGRACDLSRGIAIDGKTIVFHLTAAEPEFLQRLALPFAFALPSTTPWKVASRHPLPATGPYVIVRNDRRQLKLARNPHFHEWSRAARPDGYPDAIVMKIGVSDNAATTAVERGRIDWAPGLPGDRVDEAASRFAGQLHRNPIPQTNYFLMNTRVPPFDAVDARRAVSYAIDRDELIRRAGSGRWRFSPTCQILPPNFPGYKPYCPYTVHPSRAGSWTGPDLVMARKLIARSGTAGMRVTILSPTGFGWEDPARYLVDLLNQLGFKTSRRAFPFNALAHPFSGSRKSAQIMVAAWTADYPSAGAFIRPNLGCNSTLNESGFCNHKLDREMRQAELLQAIDPQRADDQWARLDRQFVDAAAWIPGSNGVSLDFMSKRVGNFQFHPEWGVLLDQLWVR